MKLLMVKMSTVTDWAEVVIAATALVALVMTIRQASRDAAFRKRQQAAAVFVITQHADMEWSVSVVGEKPLWRGRLTVTVLNNSAAPVHRVAVHLLNWEWQKGRVSEAGRVIGVLPPGRESKDIPFDYVPEPPRLVAETQSILYPPLEIDFTDAAGLRWRRSPDGTLTIIGQKPPLAGRVWRMFSGAAARILFGRRD